MMNDPPRPQFVQIHINQDEICLSAEPGINTALVADSKIFTDWCASIDPRFQIRAIHIQSVDMFGKNVGFIKLKADVVDRTDGGFIPGIVFMRGDSVAILVVLECDAKEYAVLAVQPRVPSGLFASREVLAGMLDSGGSFAGVAAKELCEEGGDTFTLTGDDLIDLNATTVCDQPIHLSPGGSDEAMRFFAHRRHVTREELSALQGKATGHLEEGERIKLEIVPLEDLDIIPDGKTIIAASLYRRHRRLQALQALRASREHA